MLATSQQAETSRVPSLNISREPGIYQPIPFHLSIPIIHFILDFFPLRNAMTAPSRAAWLGLMSIPVMQAGKVKQETRLHRKTWSQETKAWRRSSAEPLFPSMTLVNL